MAPQPIPLTSEQRKFLTALYEKYNARLFVLAQKYTRGHRQDAEDAVQHLWMHMAQCLHVLEDKPEGVWLPYLTTVLRNQTIGRKRTWADPPAYYHSLDEVAHLLSYESDLTERKAIRSALQKLSEQESLVLTMRYFGFTVQEISESLGIRYETCKKRLQRATNTLLHLLESEGVYIERTNP